MLGEENVDSGTTLHTAASESNFKRCQKNGERIHTAEVNLTLSGVRKTEGV
jgi:hypothetical protein